MPRMASVVIPERTWVASPCFPAALEGVAGPAAQAARQRALDAIKTVEEAIKGAGL